MRVNATLLGLWARTSEGATRSFPDVRLVKKERRAKVS